MSFLSKRHLDVAVYWERTGANAYGEPTFSPAVEVACRWEDKQEEIATGTQLNVMSSARVFTSRALVKNSYLFLGTLLDLPSDDSDPRNIENTHEIMAIGEIRSVNNKATMYKAWLE